jgi:hypothetical protein
MLSKRIVALRFFSEFDCHRGMVSYQVVLRSPISLTKINDAARSDIRRGLRHCEVERFPCRRLAEEGWILQRETLERQGRASSMSQTEWKRICITAGNLQGFEAWGATHEGELVSSLLSFSMDNTVNILYQQSKTIQHKFRVNNALIYVFSNTMLERPGIRQIFYGLHSLDAPSSVDQFKFRMGYSPLLVRQQVVFNPFIQPFINKSSYRIIKNISSSWPNNLIAQKGTGLLRNYLNGRLPLSKQQWPNVLLHKKDEILARFEKA